MKSYRPAICIAVVSAAFVLFVAFPITLVLALLAVAMCVFGFVVHSLLFDDDIGMILGADSATERKS